MVSRRKFLTLASAATLPVLFISAKKKVLHEIDQNVCDQCGDCIKACEEGAIKVHVKDGKKMHVIDPTICTQCGDCIDACEKDAILVLKVKKK